MKLGLLRSAPRLLILSTSFLLPLSATSSPALGARVAPRSAQPPFFVKLNTKRRVFYRDEPIGFGVFRRGDLVSSQSSRCSFGGNGSKSQVLYNGQVVKEFKLSYMSMTAASKIQGVAYRGFSGFIMPFDFVPGSNGAVKDGYQIRVICDDEVSAPSEAFHIEPWYEPVDGLQVQLRPQQSVYQLGEPILVEATLRNVGRRPRLCPVPTAADGYMDPFWSFFASGRLGDPRPKLAEKDLYARKLEILRPGESRTATFSLSDLQSIDTSGATKFGSKAGTYLISATVYFHAKPPREYSANLWRGEMSSNAFEIVVR